jgi:carbon-monoxide dehydrogenase medium subunit
VNPFEYAAPATLKEAIAALQAAKGQARALAGGTDLIAQMKAGRRAPGLVLDVKRIPECMALSYGKKGLRIGAAATCSAIARHPAVAESYPALAHACRLVGSVQIQNRAALGGNLCNAAPSADTSPVVICLGGRARIAGPKGTREVSVESFFTGPGATVLAPDELLVEVIIPPPAPYSACRYERFTPRAEMDIAFAGVGSWLRLDPKTKRCAEARIVLGAVAPTPVRASEAERSLAGQPLTAQAIRDAAEQAVASAKPISDQRASAAYRLELVKVLTRRTLSACAKDLGISL